MKIYKSIQRGEFHTNHCEDAMISTKIGDKKVLIAVMDGCSMGIESHFASTLFVKILKKISQELFYKEFIQSENESLSEMLFNTTKKFYSELKDSKNQLGLETNELLSTLILALYDEGAKEAEIITIGDGLIVCNKKIIEYEQGDKPDYFAYHLHKDFDEWFSNFDQKLSLKNVEDLSIMTDGIYTFKVKGQSTTYKDTTEMVNFLAIDQNSTKNEDLLQGKMIFLEKEQSVIPMDDFTMIRIKNHQ